MGKLKLDVETLQVEAFETATRPEERGTVRGAEHTYGWDCETYEHPWCGYQTYEFETCGVHPGGTGGSGSEPTAVNTCFYASCDGYTC